MDWVVTDTQKKTLTENDLTLGYNMNVIIYIITYNTHVHIITDQLIR